MVRDENNQQKLILAKVELFAPETNWERSWRRSRLSCIGSSGCSFIWKVLHNILPCEKRLSRILQNNSPTCKICSVPVEADLVHCFFECEATRDVGTWLSDWICTFDASSTPQRILRLDFECDQNHELAVVWTIAHILQYMWTVRTSGKVINMTLTRAHLEKKICLLRETRHQAEYINIQNMLAKI